METMTISKPQSKENLVKDITLEQCNDVEDIAMISVDNTQTFENKDLNELYVNEGEQAAQATKKIIEACKYYGISTINILEEHPIGHVSLAANYKNKQAFDLLSYEEVKERTAENNGIGSRAQFTLAELKRFLSEVGSQMLRPDHGIVGTPWVELTQPLEESDFDQKIIKWTNPAREAYSGFDETTLDQELSKQKKKILLIWGVATDYCVGNTARDAQEKGYQVYLITEAIRGVAKETTDTMLATLHGKGIRNISSAALCKILDKNFA